MTDYPVRVPCSTQVADQPRGVTCTFNRRRQWAQKRGGSMLSSRAQRVWSRSASGSPHWPQYVGASVTAALAPTRPGFGQQ